MEQSGLTFEKTEMTRLKSPPYYTVLLSSCASAKHLSDHAIAKNSLYGIYVRSEAFVRGKILCFSRRTGEVLALLLQVITLVISPS